MDRSWTPEYLDSVIVTKKTKEGDCVNLPAKQVGSEATGFSLDITPRLGYGLRGSKLVGVWRIKHLKNVNR